MNKLTVKNSPMYSRIKNHFVGDGELDESIQIEVITNEMSNINIKTIDKKWIEFYKFFQKNQGYIIVFGFVYETLNYHYGKCDFKFQGNREYKNWLVEHKGVFFIVSSKMEFVIPEDKTDLPDTIMSFYYEFFKMAIDYLDSTGKTKSPDNFIFKLRKKGIIVGNEHKSMIKKKGLLSRLLCK